MSTHETSKIQREQVRPAQLKPQRQLQRKRQKTKEKNVERAQSDQRPFDLEEFGRHCAHFIASIRD